MAESHAQRWDGRGPLLVRAVVRSLLAGILFFPLFPAGLGGQERAATLTGQVVSAADRTPLPYAQVRLVDEERLVVADDAGRFLFTEVAPGPLLLVVTFLGTTSNPTELTLASGQLHQVRIAMDVALDPITADIPRSEAPSKLRGFYERMDSEQGYFITRTEIEERDPSRMTDMLRRIPGVDVGSARVGRIGVSMGRGRSCAIQYFLDGIRTPFFDIDDLSPGDVAGVEVYPGVARVPIQFKHRATCGVIVIWTRDPQNF